MCVCMVTSDRLADAVQVCDVWVGGVDLYQILFNLLIVVVLKVQCGGSGEEDDEEKE